MTFELHPRLEAGTHPLGRLDGCLVLLKDNARFPWILVVPETDAEDLHQLAEDRYREVMEVVRRVSVFVSEHFSPDKLNVGCIGNMVGQMHIHIVGRSESDPAWPGTVWASDAKLAYEAPAVEAIRTAAIRHLDLLPIS